MNRNGCNPLLDDDCEDEDDDEAQELKILLVGCCGVGKSTLLHRFTEGCIERTLSPTLGGIDYKFKQHTIEGDMIKLLNFTGLPNKWGSKFLQILIRFPNDVRMSFYSMLSHVR